MKILFLTGDLNYSDGVSNHLLNLFSEIWKDNELEIHLICSGGEALEKLKDSGIKISKNKYLCHDTRSLLNFSKAYFDIRKYLKVNKVDIVHSHNHYAANIAGRAVRNLNSKTVQTIHGLIPEGGRLKHFYADCFIILNDSIKDHILENNISSERNIYKVRQGIPEERFFMKKLFNSDSGDKIPVILYASRLVEGKGADIFIKASAEVRNKYSGELKFIIAGSGDLENDLKDLSKEINTEIEFKGNVKDIFPLMKKADIFVNPTSILTEGFPMTIAESAFSGCLIISSNGKWLKEVFEDGIDGLSFRVNDHRELSEKILFALDNKKKSQEMAESFQTKAKKLFSIKEFAGKHKSIYRECLEID